MPSSDGMKTLAERLQKEGEFVNDGAACSLEVHLMAVSLYNFGHTFFSNFGKISSLKV